MPNPSKIMKDIANLMGKLEKAIVPMQLMSVELIVLSDRRDSPPGDTAKFLKYHKGIKLYLKIAQGHLASVKRLSDQLVKIVASAKFKVPYKKASAAVYDNYARFVSIESSLDYLEVVFKTLKPPVPVRP